MPQQTYVRAGNAIEQLKTPWISMIFSAILASLPPIAMYCIKRATLNRYNQPDFLVDILSRSGIVFAGGILFPILPLGTLFLAVKNTKKTITRNSKVILWLLFSGSVLNCLFVLAFYGNNINKNPFQ